MTTFFTDIALKQFDPKADERLQPSEGPNNQGTIKATYKLLGTEQVGDKIRIHKLDRGDIVDISQSRIFAENPGTELQGDIGDNDPDGVGDPDRYVDGIDLSAGGFFDYSDGGSVAAVANAPYIVIDNDRDSWLEFTITAEDTLTADQLITFYSMVSRPNG